ncbi:MAG: glycosyltransferase [bacterium]
MRHYRILRIAGLHYHAAMNALYNNNPGLESRTYADQQKIVFRNKYVYADSFSRAMNALGHDAHEIVYDLEILQKTWAREKGIRYSPEQWQTDILLQQIEHVRPDIIYFQDIHSLPYEIQRNLKAYFPFVKLIVIFRGYPGISPSTIRQLAVADVLLVGSPILLKKCNDTGLKPHLIYHSFDDEILEYLGSRDSRNDSPKYDFTFLGSSGYGYGMAHARRYWALIELMNKTNIKLWIDDERRAKGNLKANIKGCVRDTVKRFLRVCPVDRLRKIQGLRVLSGGCAAQRVRKLIEETIAQKEKISSEKAPERPLIELFPERCHTSVFGLEMYKILRESKINFNIHSVAADNTCDNMRMFQATGMGACLITDTGTNIAELFEEDYEVVTYRSLDECIDKVTYLLDHDDMRKQVAEAGQKRTLKDHTTMNRARQIDEIVHKTM